MAFVFGVVTFVLGATLVAVCLFAIPGPPAEGGGEQADAAGHGHGHGGH
ncbi:MAG TPA: hypothetical protein VLX85_12915 [Stellaceae bacterium]|nr:hypothetical protein [Stellaceae bacterium]